MTARVLVVDDHPAVRQGLEAMLDSEAGLEAVATAGDAHEGFQLAELVEPDVVLLDYHLPDEDGLWLCLRLKAAASPPRVVMYSAFADETLVLLAAICGIDGLVSKSALASELCDTLRSVHRGEVLLPTPSPATMDSAASRVDPEDLPIVGMLIHGTPPGEIAETLGVDESALADRRQAIMQRVRDRPSHRSPP